MSILMYANDYIYHNIGKIVRGYRPLTFGYYMEKPKDETQFKRQAFLDAFTGGTLGRYHQASESVERAKNTYSLYGVEYGQIKYPWLSLYGQSYSAYAGAVAGGVMQVSHNASRIYH